VIRSGEKTFCAERFRDAFRSGATRTVHDSALVLPLAQKIDDLLERLILWDDAVSKIGPIETCGERRRILQAEMLNDVGAHAFCRGCGERHKRNAREQSAQLRELPVLWPEIMAHSERSELRRWPRGRHSTLLDFPTSRRASVFLVRRTATPLAAVQSA